jgi:hypothetical protein
MTGSIDGDISAAQLDDWLEADEEPVAQLAGVGAILFVTERRVVIVRDGSGFRPRSGTRWWPHESVLRVSLSEPRRGQARIVVRTGPRPWQAVSMFFQLDRLRDAERVASEIRKRLRPHRDRR